MRSRTRKAVDGWPPVQNVNQRLNVPLVRHGPPRTLPPSTHCCKVIEHLREEHRFVWMKSQG